MILGHVQAAIAGYAQLGNAVLAVEAQAGLAHIALAQGKLAQAQQWKVSPGIAQSALPIYQRAKKPRKWAGLSVNGV